MEITEFTLQIIILGIPGIACYFTTSKLIGKIGKDTTEVFLTIFLFSVLSYLSYSILLYFADIFFKTSFSQDLIKKIFVNQKNIKDNDIIGATLTSIAISFVFSYLYRFNILIRFGQKIGATFRYGDEDVWHYFHRVPEVQKNDGWVYVRDHKLDLIYYGYISVWSESNECREIIISEVTVFSNSDATELYSAEHIYLCRNKDELTIEVPKNENQNEVKNG